MSSKLFDTLMVFLKDFFEKIDFEKIQQQGCKIPLACIGELTSGSGRLNTCQARPYSRVHFLTCKMHFIL